jgi:hypothetical protein
MYFLRNKTKITFYKLDIFKINNFYSRKRHVTDLQTTYMIKNLNQGDSKMVARGRKQKACLLKWNLGETLETHIASKATKNRQNFDSSRPTACTEHLTSRWMEKSGGPPGPQTTAPRWLGKTQTTRWAKRYPVLPQTTLSQNSIAPWTDQPPPREKRETE